MSSLIPNPNTKISNIKNKNNKKETDSIYNPDYKFDYSLDYENGVTLKISRKEYEKQIKGIKLRKTLESQDKLKNALPKIKKISRKNLSKSLDRLCGKSNKVYVTAPSADEGQCFRSSLVEHRKIGINDIINTNGFVEDCEKYFTTHYKPYQYQLNISQIKEYFSSKFDEVNNQDLIKLLEDTIVLLKLLLDSKTKKEYAMALFVFAKLRMGDKPILNSDFFNKLIAYFTTQEIELQSDFGFDTIASLKDLLNKYSSIKKSPFITKIYKFAMYSLSLSLFSKVGITFDNFNYNEMEKAALRSKFHLGPDFIHCLLDTIVFICERGYQCYKLGSISPIFHSEKSYELWFDQAQKLKEQSRFAHNFALGDICEFKFRADLDEILEKGESIVKYAFEMDSYDKATVRKFVNELWMIKVDLMTKKAAKETRTPPFSILISGDSSIGKSSIMEMLFTHFGKREKLPIDCEYKYTRNAAANFWDGFTTSQWCIIFDDVAFLHPNKAPQGDPTLMEIIQLINAVPFTPDQASLNDKGNTPVRAKLVIASTNTEDLNAHFYFACPSAVQRRFPYIITPTVRHEFLSDDGKTLDSSKCVQTGEYPDYWTFTVKKVIATPKDANGKHHKATTKNILEDETLSVFLKWFNQAIIEHNRNQNCVQTSMDTIHKAILCDSCGLPQSICDCTPVLQSGYFGNNMNLFFISYISSFFSQWFLTRVIGLEYLLGFYSNTVLGRYAFRILRFFVARNTSGNLKKGMLKNMGKMMEVITVIPPFFIYISVYLTSMYTLNKVRIFLTNLMWTSEPEVDSKDIGKAPEPEANERENVWYKESYELSSFDYTPQQTSSKRFSLEEFSKGLHNNLVHLRMYSQSESKILSTGAVCIRGNLYLVNSHALPKDNIFEIDIISMNGSDGVSSNIKTLFYKHNVCNIGNDLSILEFSCLPPRKDIISYFGNPSFTGVWDGLLLTRTAEGKVNMNYSKCISKKPATWLPDVTGEHWEYTPQTLTKNGDCGGLLITQANNGYVIAGIHYAGLHAAFSMFSGPKSAAVPVTTTILYNALVSFDRQFTPTKPALESDTAKIVLGDLNRHSPIRWIEKGSCQVYGSLLGFRSDPKTTVRKSIMCDYMEQHGFELKYTRPSMKGWGPKRKALTEIMSMEHTFDSTLLTNIVKDHARNIIAALGPKINILSVYDDFTAINGAAGVTYVDKMNRKTSMGFPWRMSKKYHMTPLQPVGGNQNPVAMSDEVMNRVNTIIGKYLNCELNHPVFTAALKDEPVTFAKAEQHATRVFMGAPVDWSIVVRKYCLSFIKLVQSNRTIFECGAGTIAQSDEWHNYYAWLTHFGEDQIVAGDYSKFDKRMSAEIIKAAFDLMITVMRSSNMTEEDIMVVQGIALDTSYPMVDYFGDLMQFNGCNPSGHPLTVIINSLANSIYMRYCYYILNPDHEIDSFQKNIHLMTYGDDNIMGVSKEAPWFNHTAVAAVLNNYSVKYTMAEKEAQSVPYINIKDSSFLKRKWVYCKDMNRYLCPLDEDSIIKSLMIWVPSGSICPSQQSIAILNSAVMEYFFYGKEIFNTKRTFFLNMVKDLELEAYYENNEFPTWDMLRDRYIESSKRVQGQEESCLNQNTPPSSSLLSDIFSEVVGDV